MNTTYQTETVKKKKSYFNFVRNIVLILLIIFTFLLSLYLYQLQKQYKQSQFKLKSESEKLKLARIELDYFKGKSIADDEFISEDFERAFQKYKQLPIGFGVNALLEKRLEQYKSLVNTKEATDSLLLSSKQQIMNYQNYLDAAQKKIIVLTQDKHTQEKFVQKLIDSLQISIKDRNYALQKLDSASNLVVSEKKLLKFQSTKGKDVIYLGEVKEGKANGEGIGIFSSGGMYEGYWSNNLRHGRGIYQWKDGEKYEGGFKEDKRNGFGIYFWKNGEKYEGYWNNDKRHGKGKIIDKSGKEKVSGEWENDELRKKQMLSQ